MWHFLKWLNDFFKHFNSSKTINDEYTETITKLLNERGITCEEYLEKMGLGDRTYYSRLINEIVELRALVAFAIRFDIDVSVLNDLLFKRGYTFKKTDPVHYAYYKLVENYRGLSLTECNELLKMVGITHELDLLPDPLKNKPKKEKK